MFVATLNKTQNYIFAIIGAEYILRWLPIGTHGGKICRAEKLVEILKNNKLSLDKLDGMKFNIITDEWKVHIIN